MRETSLNDFSDGTEEEQEAGGDDGTAPADGESKRQGTGQSERGKKAETATYGWEPDGSDCAECGIVVQRRWGDGDRFVCSDCKNW